MAATGDQTAQTMLGFQTGMLEINNVQEQYKKSLQELNDSVDDKKSAKIDMASVIEI